MATQTVQQQTTQVMREEREDRWEKITSVFRMATDVLETYSQRRLRYLEEKYGKEWWRNRHSI